MHLVFQSNPKFGALLLWKWYARSNSLVYNDRCTYHTALNKLSYFIFWYVVWLPKC